MFTGKPPYSDLISMSALYRIVEDDMPPLPTDISNVREILVDFNMAYSFLVPSANGLLNSLCETFWYAVFRKIPVLDPRLLNCWDMNGLPLHLLLKVMCRNYGLLRMNYRWMPLPLSLRATSQTTASPLHQKWTRIRFPGMHWIVWRPEEAPFQQERLIQSTSFTIHFWKLHLKNVSTHIWVRVVKMTCSIRTDCNWIFQLSLARSVRRISKNMACFVKVRQVYQ